MEETFYHKSLLPVQLYVLTIIRIVLSTMLIKIMLEWAFLILWLYDLILRLYALNLWLYVLILMNIPASKLCNLETPLNLN